MNDEVKLDEHGNPIVQPEGAAVAPEETEHKEEGEAAPSGETV